MTFHEFLAAYHSNTLDRDAGWRGYRISDAVRPRHVRQALKALGLAYAGELAVPEFMARYGVRTPEEARSILGAWWVWSRVNAGKPVRGLRIAQDGPLSPRPLGW